MHRRKSYNLVNVWSWVNIHLLPERSCPVFNKLTRHEPAIQSKKQHLVSGQLKKNIWPQWAVNLSPRYDHVILVSGYLFDRCQLIITWRSNTKEVHSKPRLDVSLSTCYLEYGSHRARLHRRCRHHRRRRRHEYAPTSNTVSHDNHEKINSWVSFCFPYMCFLWGSAWRPFGPPELCY